MKWLLRLLYGGSLAAALWILSYLDGGGRTSPILDAVLLGIVGFWIWTCLPERREIKVALHHKRANEEEAGA